MKKYRFIVAVVLIFYCSLTAAGTAKQPKLSYGGFYAGMTKTAAKEVGYGGCDYGVGFAESKENIYCEIPSAKRQLSSLKITYAKLVFKAPNLERVHEIEIHVDGKGSDIVNAVNAQYGAPFRGGDRLWMRDTPHIISVQIFKGGRSGLIKFEYNPKMQQELKKQLAAKKKTQDTRSETLKSF